MPLTFGGAYRHEDFQNGMRLHIRRKDRWRIPVMVTCSALLLIAGFFVTGSRGYFLWMASAIVLTGMALGMLFNEVYWRRFFPHRCQGVALFRETLNMEADELGIQITAESWKRSERWRDLYRVCSDERMMLLYVARKGFVMVPARFFQTPADYSAFRQWAADGVKRA